MWYIAYRYDILFISFLPRNGKTLPVPVWYLSKHQTHQKWQSASYCMRFETFTPGYTYKSTINIMAPPSNGGTFQPLQHKSGALRDRLHSYTKSTLGAGGSINEAVSCVFLYSCNSFIVDKHGFDFCSYCTLSVLHMLILSVLLGRSTAWGILCCLGSCSCNWLFQWSYHDMGGRYVYN